MTRRGFLCLPALAVAPRLERVRPAWVAQSWALNLPRAGGCVEGRVWFDEDGQRYEWSALRRGGGRPAGYQWRTGASKTSAEAKAAAEAAMEELSR